jgi:hypothetical protein
MIFTCKCAAQLIMNHARERDASIYRTFTKREIKGENSRQVMLFCALALSLDIICIAARQEARMIHRARQDPRCAALALIYLNVNGNKWRQRVASR